VPGIRSTLVVNTIDSLFEKLVDNIVLQLTYSGPSLCLALPQFSRIAQARLHNNLELDDNLELYEILLQTFCGISSLCKRAEHLVIMCKYGSDNYQSIRDPYGLIPDAIKTFF
jgi:hypothetical protein